MRNDLEREYVEYFEVRVPHMRRLAVLLCGDVHRADDNVSTAQPAPPTLELTGRRRRRSVDLAR